MGVASLFLVASQAPAQTIKTWDGGGEDNNWSTATNWTDDVAPLQANDVTGWNWTFVFADTNRLTSSNDLALAFPVRADVYRFAPSAGSFILRGGEIRVEGGVSNIIYNGSPAAQIIENNINVTRSANVEVNVRGAGGSGPVTLAGQVGCNLSVDAVATLVFQPSQPYAQRLRIERGVARLANVNCVSNTIVFSMLPASSPCVLER